LLGSSYAYFNPNKMISPESLHDRLDAAMSPVTSAGTDSDSVERQVHVIMDDDKRGKLLFQMFHPSAHGNTAQIHKGDWLNQENVLVINSATAESRMKFSLVQGRSMGVRQHSYHHEAEIMA